MMGCRCVIRPLAANGPSLGLPSGRRIRSRLVGVYTQQNACCGAYGLRLPLATNVPTWSWSADRSATISQKPATMSLEHAVDVGSAARLQLRRERLEAGIRKEYVSVKFRCFVLVKLVSLAVLMGCSQSSSTISVDAASDDSATSACIQPTEFNQSCDVDSDCVGAPDCTLQREGCAGCLGAAINKQALSQFDAKLSAVASTSNGCPCMGLFPQCIRSACALSTTADAGAD